MRNLKFFLVVAMACVTVTSDAFGQSQWHAGVAVEVITPELPMWMSGYASRNHVSAGKLHDLWAKALVIRDPNGKQLVLITLDLVGIDRAISRTICSAVQKQHHLERSQIAICTSHTHTGPVVGHNLGSMYFLDEENQKRVHDYSDALISGVVKAVAKAMDDLAPARLSYGSGTAPFAVNRRNNREADVPKLRADGNLKGPVDHAVPVLAVRSGANELKAIVFGYACHATVLSFYDWSGDWPGFAQIEIEKRHPGTVALFMAGCGADQNPLPRRKVEFAEEYGRQIAESVDKVLQADMTEVKGKLQSAYREIDLAFADLPSKEQIENDAKSKNKYTVSRAKLLLEQLASDGALETTYPYPVQTWAIGDWRSVILGGEVVVDYSLRLRNEFPDRDLWVAGYSNDVMAYIPSRRVLKEGGYEGGGSMVYYGLPTVWSERVEEHIVETVRLQMKAVDE